MPRHADDTRSRGVAGWIIGTAVAVVVLVAAVVGYVVVLNDDDADSVNTGCSGASTLRVVAGAAAPALAKIADEYNATRPIARDTCVSVQVSALASGETVDALLGGWTNQAEPPPAIWVADTLADVTAVEGEGGDLVAGHSETVWATSPVVLAVSGLQADSVPADLGWKDLPTATDSQTGVALSGNRRLSLALADPRTDLGTAFALESTVGTGSAVQVADVTAAAGQLDTLAGNSARTEDIGGLLDDLAAGSGAFTALPVLETQVAAFDATAGNEGVRAVYLTGPTVAAELVPIALTAPWLDRTQIDAASTFLAYLRSAEAVAVLQDAGWRIPTGPAPASANGVDRGVAVTPQPAAGSDVREALATAIGLPPADTGSQPSTSATENSTAGTPSGQVTTAESGTATTGAAG